MKETKLRIGIGLMIGLCSIWGRGEDFESHAKPKCNGNWCGLKGAFVNSIKKFSPDLRDLLLLCASRVRVTDDFPIFFCV